MTDDVIAAGTMPVAAEASPGAVDVVVVNWNAGDQLRRCLASIADHGGALVRSVVVVDNGSTDGSADVAVPRLPLTVVEAGTNLGFGRACNLGAAKAEAPLLLFLNPDAALLPDTLQRAVSFLESPSGRDVGVLGIKLLDERGEVQHHTTRRAVPRTMFTHQQRAIRFDHLHSRPVDHVIGAFYLIRTDVFRGVGGFDERYFVYLEDMDLSTKVQDAGWRIYYLADAVAFHKGGGVSEQVKAKRLFYSLRSRILYSFKHFPGGQAAAVTAATLVVEPALRLARAAMRRSGREAVETVSAFGQLYGDLPAMMRTAKRRRP